MDEIKNRIDSLEEIIENCQGEMDAHKKNLKDYNKEFKELKRKEELHKIDSFDELKPLITGLQIENSELKTKLISQNNTLNKVMQILAFQEDDHSKNQALYKLLFDEDDIGS